MTGLIAFVILGFLLSPLVNSIENAPEVTIDSGKLHGLLVQLNNTNNATVRKYLGIPFATAERFQAPKEPPKWSGSKAMISFGKACPQAIAPLGVQKVEDMSEDCLNLNVFVPHDIDPSSKLPVMVWIHGGGYIAGKNTLYDGSYLSVLGKVVVVVINYRLGLFGFLTNGRNGDIKGNYGMLDQIEGLKWVKRNIDAFNGDPNKVTIFGESAGGSSVSLLMLSKLGKGLFNRTIPQSGDAAAPWASESYDKLAVGVKVFAKNIGCPEDISQIKNCLASKQLMQLVNASLLTPWPTFTPVIDGDFLEDAPSVLYEKQKIEKIDVMSGVTNEEGIVFTNAIPGVSVGVDVSNGLSRDEFIKAVKSPGYLTLVIPQTNEVLLDATVYRYTDYSNMTNIYTNRRMLIDLYGDMAFLAPSVKGMQAYSKKNANTYLYRLEYRYEGSFFGLNVPSWVRAHHGADLIFVFGYPLLTEKETTAANFSREVIKMWSNFAETGNPNTPKSIDVTWPNYTVNEQKYLSLKPDLVVKGHLRADYMAYWNDFIPKALQSTPPTGQPCSSGVTNKTGFVIFLMSIAVSWLFQDSGN